MNFLVMKHGSHQPNQIGENATDIFLCSQGIVQHRHIKPCAADVQEHAVIQGTNIHGTGLAAEDEIQGFQGSGRGAGGLYKVVAGACGDNPQGHLSAK